MCARPGRGPVIVAGLALVLLALGLEHGAAAGPAAPPPAPKRRAGAAGERGRPRGAIPPPGARPPPPAPRTPRWTEPTPNQSPDRSEARRPRAYLIYLVDGGEPIVVSRY